MKYDCKYCAKYLKKDYQKCQIRQWHMENKERIIDAYFFAPCGYTFVYKKNIPIFELELNNDNL